MEKCQCRCCHFTMKPHQNKHQNSLLKDFFSFEGGNLEDAKMKYNAVFCRKLSLTSPAF